VSAPSPFQDAVVLAPLTVGGNLPFRRLCTEMGADVTVGEMAVVKKLLGGRSSEFALLKGHPDERLFGVQLADKRAETLVEGARLAESRGARFVDLNCGCPIDQITRRGLGASLLRKPAKLGRLVAAMKGAVSIPVTVKLRAGWHEDKVNVSDVARACEEGGAAERGVPVIGNGDILTPYEARERMVRTGVRSVMLGRGALVKPWLFREIKEGRDWLPTPEERFGVLWRFVELLREHFGADERGMRRTMRFLPWHLNFFCRYVPLPEEQYAELARQHPLLQSRIQAPPPASPLEKLLGDARPETHQRLAEELLASPSRDDARERALRLAELLPAEIHGGELRVSAAEVAG
jgi:tRNA-dihydrouridine synthase 3